MTCSRRVGKRPRRVVAQFEADQRAPIDVDAVTLRSGVVDYYELLQVRTPRRLSSQRTSLAACALRTSLCTVTRASPSVVTGRSVGSSGVQVPPGAKPAEIKASYRQLQKLCHPDILGPEHGHDASILLNQVRRPRAPWAGCLP